MSIHNATVLNGQIQLDTPVPLPDHSRVTVTVSEAPTNAREAWERIKQRLRERPIYAGGQHFTRDELHERR